ncbi:MAG: BREX-1 system adenine-specific DNA-methyltransferase PglX [Defluviitaleaceae bacterium]|nr:BREX-1 system adenine-specific DNA-methyltransferase PglX [Defluviitaleaceae bacterium]
MDKAAIKSYAVAARKKLIDAVTLKGADLGIAANTINIEDIAYTWFNRLIALRFMEANGYLPSNIRILSSEEPGRIEPDALREVDRLDFVKPAVVMELKSDTGINATEKLYKYILISQCNALAEIMPGMFQRLNDHTELLLPDALYRNGGIVHDLVHTIPEENFKNGVQIIGWLYQFYISEKKDEVFAGLKKNIKINKNTIPAATQLFTPEWIVKYMVENSLGRLWLERHSKVPHSHILSVIPGSPRNPLATGKDGGIPGQARDDEAIITEGLRANWKYYIDEAVQEPEVAEQLLAMRKESPISRPEDIKLIDPCMGSGHILVYAFDVLFQIYQSQGYQEREIPNLILTHNIFGLDIDDRAGQLAYFSLMMKAREYNRRFFRQEVVPQPMVYSSNGDEELSEFGSLVKIENLEDKPQQPEDITVSHYQSNLQSWIYRSLLAQKYNVVITNPPYMAPTPKQIDWVKKHYSNSKSDLCVVFIERNLGLLAKDGYLSMITMHSWMFLTSYEKFRRQLITSNDIVNMIHLGARAFEEIGGEVVQTTAFVMCQSNISDYRASYMRLVDYIGQQAKENAFFTESKHISAKESYKNIPGNLIAYWVSKGLLKAFEKGNPLEELASPKQGMSTCDVNRFVKFWYEVDINRTNIINPLNRIWVKYNKGGENRKWYGNREYVVFWGTNGTALKDNNATLRNQNAYFKPFLAWTKVTMNTTSFRWFEEDFLFDGAGGSLFVGDGKDSLYILAGLNSKVMAEMLRIISPTVNYNENHIGGVPMIIDDAVREIVEKYVLENIELSRADWDSFETSWDFVRHPLLCGERTIQAAYAKWEAACNQRFSKLKSNEEALNRIFIDIYGLQDELTPAVEDKDITIRKADLSRDIRSFVSYAVGCMLGRYNLDGLVAVEDNIIPMGDQDYFENDIVSRFIDFVRVVYGEEALGENLDFIANALYPTSNGTAQERIRQYFFKDFYKDHVKVYQNRPIYWLMDSGKRDGFKALFYLHRYDKLTITKARTDYLHPLQRKYDAGIQQLEMLANITENNHDKAAYRKEANLLQGKLEECQAYDLVISHFAHQQIELDLDDGVKVNYAKFQGVEVPMDDGRVGVMGLLWRI